MDRNISDYRRVIGYGGDYMVSGARSYKVLSQLGQGAFGAVYLADTLGTGLERRVAIKLLRPEKATIPGLIGRLRDEARMLAAIRHRAIVRVDDLVELDGAWAIVMEYVEGCDVTELLKLGPVPPVAALALAEEVAAALHAAGHQPGPDGQPLRLIHRDIKPSNLRLTAVGELKILDFGVARADLAKREEATEDAAFGTVPYMAPERFYGEDSHAGDIYALGVTLFEMLTGVKPGKTAMDADRQPPGERYRAQWAWLAEISMPLHDLISSMLAKKPGDRPTARETVKLCATIRAGLPGDTLDEWAEKVIPGALKIQVERRATASDRTGTLLFERSGALPLSAPAAPATGLSVWLAGTGALVGAGVVGLLVVIPLVYFGLTLESAPDETAAAVPIASGPPAAVTVPSAPLGASPPPAGPAAVARVDPAVPGTPSAVGEPPSGGSAPSVGGGPSAAAVPSAVAVPTARVPNAAVPSAPAVPSAAGSAPTPEKSVATAVKPAADKPAARPAVEPAPAATAEPPSGPGTVALAGDASGAVLSAGGRTFGPGEVPAGTYTAEVTFNNGTTVTLRSVVVDPGATTTLRCSAAFSNCKVQRN